MSDQGHTIHNATAMDRAHALAGQISTGLMTGFAAFGTGLRRMTKRAQYNRMQSVLAAASDTQLAEIGITRADIPRHAADLVDYEYDGL